MAHSDEVPIRPAATVIVVRDGAEAEGLEVLLLRRSAELVFHGGSWVFPGGRIDHGDYPPGAPHDHEAAARRAAVREAQEEAGIVLDEVALLPWAHWTTPPGRPRRFATWFYLAPILDADHVVTIDGGEIHEHLWLTPLEALAANRRGEVELPAPTFVSLQRLTTYLSVRDAVARVPSERYHEFTPRIVNSGRERVVSIYHGDVLYEVGDDALDLEAPGPRHRLWMSPPAWRYEHDLT